jgi:preprotein translocase subunit SecA
MILDFLTKIFGSSNDRVVNKFVGRVDPINALEPHYEAMGDEELKAQTDILRARLRDGETENDILNDAFAVVREAAKRSLGQRHYDVQLIGGLVLHDGKISEMKTGEGKTLVSTLPVYLNALSGKGVHVVTVNDYLAQRDAEWMGHIYGFLGMSTGCILSGLDNEARRAAYACDITYGTNNEFGFDYLRDNMKYRPEAMVQRPFHYAIVDEVDSILIDEARTPLIISGPSDSNVELYTQVNLLIPKLTEEDYELDEKHRTIVMTEEGQEHVENLLREHGLLAEGSMYDIHNISLVHHANQALKAHKLFHKDKDYMIRDGKVMLIDEFTGRMMDGRRLSEGLHQAIEAKEGVEVQSENQTLASITYQNYFRLYPKLAGMTGTAMTEAGEFMEIYGLGVVAIPTHKPVSRLDHEDKIYRSLAEKNTAIIELIKECQERKQPVLVGTVSIESSEKLSAALSKAKIKHNVLNAKYHEQEAYIVAQAGRPGSVTIATNMAGRGTDIKLGGNAEMRILKEIDESWSDAKKATAIEKITQEVKDHEELVKEAGGLYVVGTERHESRRIDNQLRGRSGRQADPGASMFFLSVEDDLMRIFAGERMESLLNNSRIGLKEGEALEHPLISKMLEHAQRKVEQMHFEVRKNLLKFDDVMNEQRKEVYEQRREIMLAPDIDDFIKDMRYDIIEDIIAQAVPAGTYAEQWNADLMHTETLRLLGIDIPSKDWFAEEGIASEEILDRLKDLSDRKMARKAVEMGPKVWQQIQRTIMLQILDQHWKEHLLNLDHLRQGINLRAFGQRDPLNEYKTEAYALFELMVIQMREQVTQTLSLVELGVHEDGGHSLLMPGMGNPQNTRETHNDPAIEKPQDQVKAKVTPFAQRPKTEVNRDDPDTWGRVKRNADCPCGSGKKFKHCHGSIAAGSNIA